MVLIKEKKSYMEMTNISHILIWAMLISIRRVEIRKPQPFLVSIGSIFLNMKHYLHSVISNSIKYLANLCNVIFRANVEFQMIQ